MEPPHRERQLSLNPARKALRWVTRHQNIAVAIQWMAG
jgi:hypothetical protein